MTSYNGGKLVYDIIRINYLFLQVTADLPVELHCVFLKTVQ